MAKIVHIGSEIEMHLSVLTDDDSVLPSKCFKFILHKLTDDSFDELKGLMRRQFADMLAELAAVEAAAQVQDLTLQDSAPSVDESAGAVEELPAVSKAIEAEPAIPPDSTPGA